MNVKMLNLKGMKCLKITWTMTGELNKMRKGEILEVIADCPSFAKDVKKWCQKHKKALMRFKEERNGVKRCQIRI